MTREFISVAVGRHKSTNYYESGSTVFGRGSTELCRDGVKARSAGCIKVHSLNHLHAFVDGDCGCQATAWCRLAIAAGWGGDFVATFTPFVIAIEALATASGTHPVSAGYETYSPSHPPSEDITHDVLPHGAIPIIEAGHNSDTADNRCVRARVCVVRWCVCCAKPFVDLLWRYIY